MALKKEKKKKMTYKEELAIWRKKMRELIYSEPIPPAMKRIAAKMRRLREKEEVKRYVPDADHKKAIHEHWDEKYGQGLS